MKKDIYRRKKGRKKAMTEVVPNYNLVIRSSDKISGDNNDCTFDVRWNTVLSPFYDRYVMSWNFYSSGASLKDGTYSSVDYFFQTAAVHLDFESKKFIYDTKSKSQSTYAGIIYRYESTAADGVTSFMKSDLTTNFPLVMSRPTQADLKVSLWHVGSNSDTLFTDGESGFFADDFVDWTMTLSFSPVLDSYNKI